MTMTTPAPSGLPFTTLVDWTEGRLSTDRADQVQAAVAARDPEVLASIAWLNHFHYNASAMPLRVPPASVGQRLREHFASYSSARATEDLEIKAILLDLTFDSRVDRPLAAVRSASSVSDTVHLAYGNDEADVVLAVQPQTDGTFRIEGQVMLVEDAHAVAYKVSVAGPAETLGTVQCDDLGRFTLEAVSATANRLTICADELTLTCALALEAPERGGGTG